MSAVKEPGSSRPISFFISAGITEIPRDQAKLWQKRRPQNPRLDQKKACLAGLLCTPRVGLEPTTLRLTHDRCQAMQRIDAGWWTGHVT